MTKTTRITIFSTRAMDYQMYVQVYYCSIFLHLFKGRSSTIHRPVCSWNHTVLVLL